MRIKDFINIFLNHYGEEILSNLTNYNSESFKNKIEKLHFEENKTKINAFLIKYQRSKSSGCKNPKCMGNNTGSDTICFLVNIGQN